ncbi:hypothetical protein M9H77_18877 [Catharanthus roseus]|uniref:Uncharacterized protein n=1 Tax=Catharanthus roseus TaxID=4058 RepID=A0ACC0B8Q3_CATRO|nr:hypothetical protein M9H77_18877 [Catharanthus roseus]
MVQVHPATVSYEQTHKHVQLNPIMKDTCSSYAPILKAFIYEPLAIEVHHRTKNLPQLDNHNFHHQSRNVEQRDRSTTEDKLLRPRARPLPLPLGARDVLPLPRDPEPKPKPEPDPEPEPEPDLRDFCIFR